VVPRKLVRCPLDVHILILLRALVPYRKLNHAEALFFAEQQAAVLLQLVQVFEPPVDVEQIALDACIVAAIQDDPDQQNSGKASFNQTTGSWLITLNPEGRAAGSAFVIAHEMKHIMDNGFGELLYRPVDFMATEYRREHAANYFAACLTMPRPWLERCWKKGECNATELSQHFNVPAGSMQFRLEALGMIGPETEGSGVAKTAPRGWTP
jgi:Zn-dependent peptidase ImmA (M78 family)